jgi:hypothetical protein
MIREMNIDPKIPRIKWLHMGGSFLSTIGAITVYHHTDIWVALGVLARLFLIHE